MRKLNRSVLILAIGTVTGVIQLLFGWNAWSFALWADIGHELIDNVSTAIPAIVEWKALRGSHDRRALQIWGGKASALILALVSLGSVVGGIAELFDLTPEAIGLRVAVLAGIGAAANVIQLAILRRAPDDEWDETFHVLRSHLRYDVAQSASVALCGVLMLWYQSGIFDAVFAIAIGGLMFKNIASQWPKIAQGLVAPCGHDHGRGHERRCDRSGHGHHHGHACPYDHDGGAHGLVGHDRDG